MLAVSHCSGPTGDLKVLQRSLNHGANLRVLGLLCGTTDLLQLPPRHLDFLRSQGVLGFGKSCPVCNSEFLIGQGNLSHWFRILPICTLSHYSSFSSGFTVDSIMSSGILRIVNFCFLCLSVTGSGGACACEIESTGVRGPWIDVCSPNGSANFQVCKCSLFPTQTERAVNSCGGSMNVV